MVIKVWGKADRFDIIFSNLGNDKWAATVPADLEDGQYIVELYCEDDSGSRAYWTGILYLSNGENATVRIVADKFKLWMMNESNVRLEDDKLSLMVSVVNCMRRR